MADTTWDDLVAQGLNPTVNAQGQVVINMPDFGGEIVIPGVKLPQGSGGPNVGDNPNNDVEGGDPNDRGPRESKPIEPVPVEPVPDETVPVVPAENETRTNEDGSVDIYVNGAWKDYYVHLAEISKPDPVDYDAMLDPLLASQEARYNEQLEQARLDNDRNLAAQEVRYQQQQQAAEATRLRQFATQANQNADVARSGTDATFAQRGLKTDGQFSDIYQSIMADIDARLGTALSSNGQDYGGLQGYSGASSRLNAREADLRTGYQTEFDATEFGKFGDDAFTGIVDSIINDRFNPVREELGNATARGSLTDIQLGNIENAITGREDTVRSDLTARSNALRGDYNAQLETGRQSGQRAIDNFGLGGSVDVGSFGENSATSFQGFQDGARENISSSLGAAPSFADFFAKRGGVTGTEQVLGGDGTSGAPVSRGVTKRGLGTQGVF